MHILLKTLIVGTLLAVAATLVLRLYPDISRQISSLKMQSQRQQMLLAKLQRNLETMEQIVQTANKAKNSTQYQEAIKVSKGVISDSRLIVNQLRGLPQKASAAFNSETEKIGSFIGNLKLKILNFF